MWQELLIFGLKTLFLVVSLLTVLLFIFLLVARNKVVESFKIESLNERFEDWAHRLKEVLFTKKEWKAFTKAEKKKAKQNENVERRRVFVLSFEGDIKASQVESLRKEITMILGVATEKDEVVVLVDSPGGMVHTYGLAASQLMRIRSRNIPLTICVDKVAASGGYLMACVAHKIIAAPFAIIGSIGVIAQVPNFHRLLERNNVDYEEITAGDYKRTVSLFGKITERGKEKFKEQIEDTHELFKSFVKESRPHLDITKVATGEHWYGRQALELGLIDEVSTSDDYIYSLRNQTKIYKISCVGKKKFTERLADAMSMSMVRIFEYIWQKQFFRF
jgi:serine protease SohB